MKCPKCGAELKEGNLLCEYCGEEVKVVPDYEIEVENEIKSVLQSVALEFMNNDNINCDDDFDKEIDDEFADTFEYNNLSRFSIYIQNIETKKIVIILTAIVIIAVGISCIFFMNSNKKNSYSYHYEKAIECAINNNFEDAVTYLERALTIEPDNVEGRFLLAKYYANCDRLQSAIKVLHEMSDMSSISDEEYEAVYDFLISLYEKNEDYLAIGDTLKKCPIERIVLKYNKYASLKPEFNKEPGVYSEKIAISLSSNTKGIIYYTIDGSNPTQYSSVYQTPIMLESGDYVIKALFVNMYGVESDVVSNSYYISLTVPKDPVVNHDSGNYTGAQFIEIFHNEDTKIFYTEDGSVPTVNSKRYTEPIEMPFGISNFAIVAIDDAGLSSNVLYRSYQLTSNGNFTADLALEVLKNNLLVNEIILDKEGHVPSKLGYNEYKIMSIVKISDIEYFMVSESYIDTTGKAHPTNNIYAINIANADIYKATKLSEGKYILNSFTQ